MATFPQSTSSEIGVDAAMPAEYLRQPLFPAIRWGAVLAGVAVGISIQLALTLLGIASGLSSAGMTQDDNVGAGPLLWAGVSMLIAAFAGGYVAARMSGLKRKSDGVLHGAVSWAVTTILFAVLATSAGGSLISGVFANVGQIARGAVEGDTGAMMRGQNGIMDAEELQNFQQAIQAGRREEAITQLTDATGMDRARAEKIVDQALVLSGSAESASPQGRAAVETAVQGAGAAAWVVFAAVALALAVGIGGGALGAAGARRISWSGTMGTPVRTS
ncbi:hypothetical protein D3870_12480 [Noviherbaspirillum cavernae]|uniref:PhnA-like protein n=1 Tax=Noviherbaspirillum cavernae TaxID=2320862 RepID=A0A418X2L9_9BURK|nr:hypothetical protein [Noviherbaspirillum cavernae]RJG06712.1 hypothetical protein D3870_12480 [Noviherbaspirillum cavernae]